MHRRNQVVFVLAAVLALGSAPSESAAAGLPGSNESSGGGPALASDGPEAPLGTTVFLVRHAEKSDPPPEDAPLDRRGRERAERLAELLRDAGITGILSTDLARTLQTAGPLAERLGLEIEIYDHRALAALAARLAATPGRFLVSGHSNTTPELVRLLGGQAGEPIDEPSEFDRLYVVTLTPGRPASTVLLRYGKPAGASPPTDPDALVEP